jgi:hypothetical protein
MWAIKGNDKKYFLILSTQIGYGAHPVSYSIAVRGSYHEGKVARTSSSLITVINSRFQDGVRLYFQSCMFHGAVSNQKQELPYILRQVII